MLSSRSRVTFMRALAAAVIAAASAAVHEVPRITDRYSSPYGSYGWGAEPAFDYEAEPLPEYVEIIVLSVANLTTVGDSNWPMAQVKCSRS